MNFNENNEAISLCYATFNQDYSSLLVGRKTGYSIHPLTSPQKSLVTLYKFENSEPVSLIERLFSTSLIGFVSSISDSSSSPPPSSFSSSSSSSKLILHHFKKQVQVCSYNFQSKILAIKFNRTRLVICLEDCLVIHDLMDLRLLHSIKDVPLHTSSTLCLSPGNCLLAYPSDNHSGGVVVFDAETLKAIWTIEAHDSVISTMTFSQDGSLLATASVKGTVIRVFSIDGKCKLYEFRRGIKRCASVFSLSFSKNNSFLACSSSTETVHIFKLEQNKQQVSSSSSSSSVATATTPPSNSSDQGWMGYLGQAILNSTSYLPSQVSEVLLQERDFAVARLPFSGPRNLCALVNIDKELLLLVLLSDGVLMVYRVDQEAGGDCVLTAEHNLNLPTKQLIKPLISNSNIPNTSTTPNILNTNSNTTTTTTTTTTIADSTKNTNKTFPSTSALTSGGSQATSCTSGAPQEERTLKMEEQLEGGIASSSSSSSSLEMWTKIKDEFPQTKEATPTWNLNPKSYASILGDQNIHNNKKQEKNENKKNNKKKVIEKQDDGSIDRTCTGGHCPGGQMEKMLPRQRNQQIKSEGELVLRDAMLSIEGEKEEEEEEERNN